ncbi:MAG: aldose epimerase [Gammaproteobacteria bacterium GWE2_37_16]|nr:MAG: aldose epimerase [Gammaproteobacteria bacterium GWE2_37_16]
MPIKSVYKDFAVYTIQSSDGKTRMSFVPEKGGVGSSLIMPYNGKERELLFQHDHFWLRKQQRIPGGWPFLFPVCARLERNGVAGDYLYDGHVYNMNIHGFSSRMPWQVVDEDKLDQITLVLIDTKETRAIYPFSFRVELIYKIANSKLICLQRYTNTGDNLMPYYAGFHPYFTTPELGQGKEQVMLDYHPKRHFQYNERTSDLIGEQPLFPIPIPVTSPLVHEQLVLLGENKQITLVYPDGLAIKFQADGVEDENLFPYVQTYSPPDQPFVCVEPWMSFPNALNTVQGVRCLKPQQSESGILTLWV